MDISLQNYFLTNSDDKKLKTHNSEMDYKVLKLTEKLTDAIHSIVNEPSIALFRIDENVRKSVPQLLEQNKEFKKMNNLIQGEHFDMEYEMSAIKNIQASKQPLKRLAESMKNCIYIKQQLDYNLQHRSPNMNSTDLLSNWMDNISLASSSFVDGVSRHLRSQRSIDLTKRAKLTRSAEFSFDFGLASRYDNSVYSQTLSNRYSTVSHCRADVVDSNLKND